MKMAILDLSKACQEQGVQDYCVCAGGRTAKEHKSVFPVPSEVLPGWLKPLAMKFLTCHPLIRADRASID